MSDNDTPMDDAMASMMGFSNFTGTETKKASGQKRVKLNKSSTPGTSANSAPLGTRPARTTPTTTAPYQVGPSTQETSTRLEPEINLNAAQSHFTPPSASTFNNTDRQSSFQDRNSRSGQGEWKGRAWTNPYTGVEWTSDELNSCAGGVDRGDGVMVYFKPGFIEDPWRGRM